METKWNWMEFLIGAIEKEPSQAEYTEANFLAKDWPTCACGELCKGIPRDDYGKPKDVGLRGLGLDFSRYVGEEDWPKAMGTFLRIEDRVGELLKEQGSKSKETA